MNNDHLELSTSTSILLPQITQFLTNSFFITYSYALIIIFLCSYFYILIGMFTLSQLPAGMFPYKSYRVGVNCQSEG